jgi:subtilisin family serine protease
MVADAGLLMRQCEEFFSGSTLGTLETRYLYLCKMLVVAGLVVVGFRVPAGAQVDVSKACSEQAGKRPDANPTSVRLIDADCELIEKSDSSFTDKNYRSQSMHGVTDLRSENLWGQGVTVGIWDAGHVLDRHVELADRVSFGDPGRTQDAGGSIPVTLNGHSTHVAGTIGAGGSKQLAAQGMAPQAKIVSFFWGTSGQDVEDLKRARSLGISVTNHSYGKRGGWEFYRPGACGKNWSWLGRDEDDEEVRFGAYDDAASLFDKVVWENKSLSVFVAAGNERGFSADPEKFRGHDNPELNFTGEHCAIHNGAWIVSSKPRKSDLWKNGFDTITGRGLAKNVVTIGASVRLDPPFKNYEIRPTDFSSMGPADDGRIKPDLLANGDNLFSTYLPDRCLSNRCYPQDLTSEELERYTTLPGTSMATPIATGIAALLNQKSQEGDRGRVLFADEMKAALVHTAKSPTDDGRPNYRWGWGLIDALRAAQLVAGTDGTLRRLELAENGAAATEIKLTWKDRSESFALTAVWLDEPGKVAATPAIDDRTPNLVNRLDVRLISPSGKNFFPWSLDPEKPDQLATNNMANMIDNVQRIDVAIREWEAGTWRLVIKPASPPASKLALALALSKVAALRPD